jgi:PAS domain S-box-containing protein
MKELYEDCSSREELASQSVELESRLRESPVTFLESFEGASELGVRHPEVAPVACCGLDAAGTITDINVEGERLLGSPRSALVGRSLAWFFAPADRSALREHVRSCAEREERMSLCARLGEPGPGRVAGVETRVVSVPQRSAQSGVLTLVTAIVETTERRAD